MMDKTEDKVSRETPKELSTVQLQAMLDKTEAPEQDEAWIKDKTDEEIARLIMTLARELEERATNPTDRIDIEEAPTFESDLFKEVREFKKVPNGARAENGKPWRMILLSFRVAHKPIGLEVHGDTMIGRGAVDGVSADVDLASYDGEELGVSRRHAKITHTETGPRLMDLGSTNGTYCNGTKLGKGMSQVLRDGDTISLGAMHFKVKVVE